MTDLQVLVRQTSNQSILKMQQRLHAEVVELGKQALQWKEGCLALQLALETERGAANLYAKQVAHWIGKHDELLAQQLAQRGESPCLKCDFYMHATTIEPCSSCLHGGNFKDNFKPAVDSHNV